MLSPYSFNAVKYRDRVDENLCMAAPPDYYVVL